jgi:hypothetical protein
MTLTRRRMSAALTSAAALGSVAGFTSAALSAQSAPVPQPDAADLLRSALAEVAANSAALAKLDVPMTTEPAFQFKA